MEKQHLPSVEALTSFDDDLMMAELEFSEVRENVDRVRAVLAELERLGSAPEPFRGTGGPSCGDVAEALARVGYRIVEIASALSRVAPSGIRPQSSLDAAPT